MVKKYIPSQGDIVYVDLDSTMGHEQKGKRPAVVISNNYYNEFTKMIIVCPITSNEKDFPTHYTLFNSEKIHGSVLCEHIRSIDYLSRKVKFVEKCSKEDLIGIITLMNACIEE